MILVDTSVWIEFFKGNSETIVLYKLIDDNTLCVNDLILAELLPSINQKKESNLKELLYCITNIQLKINWKEIIFMQTVNLKNGINKVGIPDLIIAQNAIENSLELFTSPHISQK
jgi:predicted nucleic acid-binding protein